ncbi:VOC family protein [Marinifilum flexuosum]|uniref:VOC family protein n=1 Tax=Marinifilum flexuosum TaxID=1117708 RepID=UPI002495A57E|nr:VOC family protein [Marinifilum flexuosum]
MRKLITLVILGISVCSCTNFKAKEFNHIKQERDSLLSILNQNKANLNKQIVSFLTFQEDNAEEAMNFYVELFDNSKVIEIQRYQKGEPKEGTVKFAKFSLNGSPFMCSDSYIKHDWTFTPAISIFVEIETEEKLNKIFDKLSEGGKIMMPIDNYGFSKKFAFVEDRFGVSWQLNLK